MHQLCISQHVLHDRYLFLTELFLLRCAGVCVPRPLVVPSELFSLPPEPLLVPQTSIVGYISRFYLRQ
jgi:hypothetical protein